MRQVLPAQGRTPPRGKTACVTARFEDFPFGFYGPLQMQRPFLHRSCR
jgi:hypothetical protein